MNRTTNFFRSPFSRKGGKKQPPRRHELSARRLKGREKNKKIQLNTPHAKFHFRDIALSATSVASSREESIAILDRYRDELSAEEYGWIYSSIATHAIEGMYLGEQEVVLGIAQLKGELSMDEVFEIVVTAAA